MSYTIKYSFNPVTVVRVMQARAGSLVQLGSYSSDVIVHVQKSSVKEFYVDLEQQAFAFVFHDGTQEKRQYPEALIIGHSFLRQNIDICAESGHETPESRNKFFGVWRQQELKLGMDAKTAKIILPVKPSKLLENRLK